MKTEEIELDRDGVADTDMTQYYETISIGTESSSTSPKTVKASDSITRIYVTATMWHETTDEMLAFLRSIFHMDEDQSARRVAQKYLKVITSRFFLCFGKNNWVNSIGGKWNVVVVFFKDFWWILLLD